MSIFQGPLVRWLKVNFSESFTAWVHIKALRVFVESVLRSVIMSRCLDVLEVTLVTLHKTLFTENARQIYIYIFVDMVYRLTSRPCYSGHIRRLFVVLEMSSDSCTHTWTPPQEMETWTLTSPDSMSVCRTIMPMCVIP